MKNQNYGPRKEAILAIITAAPGISSTEVRDAYDANSGKKSGDSSVSSILSELYKAGKVRREKVLSPTCGFFYRYWLIKTPSSTSRVSVTPVQAQQPGKQEYTKQFDLKAAKAGAPFGCSDGQEVEILKWDAAGGNCPLVGMVGESVQRWSVNGEAGGPNKQHLGLVMLPLGIVAGKPVFAGDQLVEEHYSGGEESFVAGPTMRQGHFDHAWWPAPAPVYPTTQLSFNELAGVYEGTYSTMEGYRAIANAALRHAIDAGQVVLPNGDGISAELVRAQELLAETRKMLARDAARDMAVAQAVRSECVRTCAAYFGSFDPVAAINGMVTNEVLSAIIAGVAK